MTEFIRRGNPGLERRFQVENAFVFEDYDDAALLTMLLGRATKQGRPLSFDVAKAAVKKCLRRDRMKPNFGNAGAVNTLLAKAIERSEARLMDLPPVERAERSELLLEDFYVEPHYVKNPDAIFDGIIGCEEPRRMLLEYRRVVDAARAMGRDPLDDLELTFQFCGPPGTGKTTIARRLGQMFESLEILPSSDVVSKSASDFETGFVGSPSSAPRNTSFCCCSEFRFFFGNGFDFAMLTGQAGKKTREIFEEALGGVLCIDEAYRFYDRTGRTYMKEAVDEIVNLLTEPRYHGKIVVVFAGYEAELTAMLDNVNPGLKSRVTQKITFEPFDAAAAADLFRLEMVTKKRFTLDVADAALRGLAQRLVDAPQWASGRDVETWAKRTARHASGATTVTLAACTAAVDDLVKHKKTSAAEKTSHEPNHHDAPCLAAAATTSYSSPTITPAAIETDDWVLCPPETQVAAAGNTNDDDDDVNAALQEACVKLGYDETHEMRQKLQAILQNAADGASLSDDILDYVVEKTGTLDKMKLNQILRPQVPAILVSVKAKIQYEEDRLADLARLEEEARQRALALEKAIQSKLMGRCPMGYSWYRSGSGWRCTGGSHYVSGDDPLLH